MGKKVLKAKDFAVNSQVIDVFLLIAAIGTVIKSIFTEWSYDNTYHLAMAWRHINGDRLFGEMWEPHQTSSFVIDLLVFIYYAIMPDMTFVALYLQIVGALIYSLSVWVLYTALKKEMNGNLAFVLSLILLSYRPKKTTIIEFSNLLMIGSFLLLAFLINFHRRARLILCLGSAFVTCIMVLAYPSCVLIFIPVFIYFCKNGKKYGITYLSFCALSGLLYLSHIMVSNGLNMFLSNCCDIISSDSSHSGFAFANIFYFQGEFPYTLNIVFPLLMLVGLFGVKQLNDQERFIWKMGTVISLFLFTGVILLTNLSIFRSLGYLVLGGTVSLLPGRKLGCRKEQAYVRIVCFCILVISGLWVYNGYSALKDHLVLKCENIIRKGPEAGIVAPLSIVNYNRESMEDWENALCSDDVVLAVGPWISDSSVYLFAKADIAHYSTIDTPTYSEKLDVYWEKYPYKKPTVIAFESYRETKKPDEVYPYIDQLIKKEYELSYVGQQWLFYRLVED